MKTLTNSQTWKETLPDITPLLVAFGGHRGPLDGCAHDAMFRMTAVMAGGAAPARK